MSDAQKFRTMDWIVGLATTVALCVSGWSLLRIVEISERVAVIESTRFTAEDAEKQIKPKLDLILLSLQNVSEDVKRLEEKIEKQ